MARVTVGRRLTFLVLLNVFAMALVVAASAVALGKASAEETFDRDYVFPPIEAVEARVENDVAVLRDLVRTNGGEGANARARDTIGGLRDFANVYRSRWQLEGKTTPSAVKMRAELERQGRYDVIDEENVGLRDLDAALARVEHVLAERPDALPLRDADVNDIRRALLQLENSNIKQMRAAWVRTSRTQVNATGVVAAVALVSIVGTPLAGLAIRHAIAPRLARLAAKVRRFSELGVLERFQDPGGDEIAVLAHALDVSFGAIVDRNKDRDRFLGIAAHELKTPLASIKGYADLALMQPDDERVLRRALEVISRQSTRLGRLSEDLLLVARARDGKLGFRPAPTDLAALVRRVIEEVNVAARSRTFLLAPIEREPHLLLDASLVEHGLWSVLSYAVAISAPPTPIEVSLDGDAMRATVEVRVREHDALPADLETLVEPFAAMQYEGRGELRDTGIGLHLCRDIARLHHARFEIERARDESVVFRFSFLR